MDVSLSAYFAADYFAARARFRAATAGDGFRREIHEVEARGPDGETLTIDAAVLGSTDPRRVVIVSSGRGVEIRILHGALPSRPFRASLARQTRMDASRFELRHCPRVHLKLVVVDGASLYLGSANFTGAGLGAKNDGRRNFELGLMTDDDVLLDAAQLRFDRIWSGRECGACRLRSSCPNPLDQVEGGHERSNSSKRYSTSRRTSAC
jgi:phosphatidylserine/phosphatidylglycerophosphate/cardiolipin synthase-like enzyme